jgi:uncharacterized linocin/CFP29 family protein
MPVDILGGMQDFTHFFGGDAADRLLAANMDTGVLRPYIDSKGRSCYEVKNQQTGKSQVLLMKDQWIRMDEVVTRTTRDELRVYGDIVGAGLTYNLPNAMGTTVIQHQSMSDAGDATISMDGLRQSNQDRVTYDIAQIPVPLIHSDFHYSLREIAVSRTQGTPLDTTMIEQNTRKCTEQTEKLFLGTAGTYTYGGGTIYGLTNFPQRFTKTITLPTDPGWTPETLNNEILDALQTLQDANFKGPYLAWYSSSWMKYLFADYSSMYPGVTTMMRLERNNLIRSWRQADYLAANKIVIVQMTQSVIQAVRGLRFRTYQWDSHGGFQKNFKILGCAFPRIRKNSNNETGIMDITAA